MTDAAAEIARLRERERQLIEVTSLLSGPCSLAELLAEIVTSLREVTCADAGSLYLREGEDQLRFAVAQNDSCRIPFTSFTMPLAPSNIAGYVALSGKPCRFADVYHLDPSLPFRFNAAIDRKYGYRAMSMLVVPMRNRKHEVVGVIQLINKKRVCAAKITDEASARSAVLAFTDEDENFLDILASQAAIAVERAALYEGIERVLRGIVEMSAAAIESRDKTTAGHSQRLAAYLVIMAKRMNRRHWQDRQFPPDEIRSFFYAAMLHDVGKIGVRENVLTKVNKLTPNRMEVLRLRLLLAGALDPAHRTEYEEILKFLQEVNVPGFLDDARFNRLQELARREIPDGQGGRRPLLDDFELECLSVRKGNLTAAERTEMESHVKHTREILETIPWTEDLKRVPEYAGSHHEKLNGKGYPDGVSAEKIPLAGRMLAVVDVFEALTAQDRPYKPAMPAAKAFDILRQEARAGALQTEIVEFFIEEKIHEALPESQRRQFTLTAEQILELE